MLAIARRDVCSRDAFGFGLRLVLSAEYVSLSLILPRCAAPFSNRAILGIGWGLEWAFGE